MEAIGGGGLRQLLKYLYMYSIAGLLPALLQPAVWGGGGGSKWVHLYVITYQCFGSSPDPGLVPASSRSVDTDPRRLKMFS